MAKLNLSASYHRNFGGKNIEVNVSLYSYEEEGLHIVYSPAFDLYGYGRSTEEAKESFGVVLDEFIKYTYNKGTFLDELKRLGWNVNKVKKRISKLEAPDLNVLLRDNETFNDIYNNKSPHRESKTVAIPQLA